jgi:hypothetical protein
VFRQGVTMFTASGSFSPLAKQNLQIGTAVQKSQGSPYPRYCTLMVYDLSALSESFQCYYVYGDQVPLKLESDAYRKQHVRKDANTAILPSSLMSAQGLSPSA